ncbi:uncharacterized protein N7479_008914 [Penicillium vulpinum]|uniref:Uncharacterized protein n=1 Tax=Penicillium vulpinum TaxID=29845 RepID=A0A1V6REY1_9EURO|nr:uncharacterized protein N7479_008914 [Penicillium vulpinum]KAJ5950501.1 hypothetical protein N7479_008914 [Penicillium vulpinum]OQE00342.1 hypothetical protein PENVUL_c053G08601 [Penicillium vulpinum]
MAAESLSPEEKALEDVLKKLRKDSADNFMLLGFYSLFGTSCLNEMLLRAATDRKAKLSRHDEIQFPWGNAWLLPDSKFDGSSCNEAFANLQQLELVYSSVTFEVSGVKINTFSIKKGACKLILGLLGTRCAEELILIAVDGLQYLISHLSDYFPTSPPPPAIFQSHIQALWSHVEHPWKNVTEVPPSPVNFRKLSIKSLQMFVSYFRLSSENEARATEAYKCMSELLKDLPESGANQKFGVNRPLPSMGQIEQDLPMVPFIALKEAKSFLKYELKTEGGSDMQVINDNMRLLWLECVGYLYGKVGEDTKAKWFLECVQKVRKRSSGDGLGAIWTREDKNAIQQRLKVRLQRELELERDRRWSYLDDHMPTWGEEDKEVLSPRGICSFQYV